MIPQYGILIICLLNLFYIGCAFFSSFCDPCPKEQPLNLCTGYWYQEVTRLGGFVYFFFNLVFAIVLICHEAPRYIHVEVKFTQPKSEPVIQRAEI